MTSAQSDPAPVIVWFRQDLRLADNPALGAAIQTGAPILPLYILDDDGAGGWKPGGASRWWLHHSLAALNESLEKRGSRLVLRRGPASEVLDDVIAKTGASGVLWNRLYEPWAIRRDTALKKRLTGDGRTVESFNAALLFEPWTIKTGGGSPYRVFTPFWRACLSAEPPEHPKPAPRELTAPSAWPRSDKLESWDLTPRKPDWAKGFADDWTPGEDGARSRLTAFLRKGIAGYAKGRDRPDEEGTSRLSPHLHFGEIGLRQVWHRVQAAIAADQISSSQGEGFLRELGWREFSTQLLFHNPELPEQPLQPAFVEMPWRRDQKALRAWQQGRTGYPIVDAGMRQLWQTGWMHNRVRMVVGSFLVKHLLLPWQAGEAWFWDTLVDADLANNAQNWQWVAGCGADAAPYFRVFNPILQGEKFDPEGSYVRRFVPELAKLPTKVIHKPWTADDETLAQAGIELGRDYPHPIVEHRLGRQRALDAWQSLRAET